MNISALQEEWLHAENKKINRGGKAKGKRQYLHLDDRIAEISNDLVADIWDPSWVLSHPFYPFIRARKIIKKHKKVDTEDGSKRTVIKPKIRPIDYAAHTDAVIYAWYAYILSDLYEQRLRSLGISENVIAYRSLDGKSNLDFAKEIFDFIKTHPGYVAVALDITGFFENIDHGILKAQWADLLGEERLPEDHYVVFRAVTGYRYVPMETLRRVFKFRPHDHPRMRRICPSRDFREKICDKGLLRRNTNVGKSGGGAGIPQGSPISCVLSNLYMLDFDRTLTNTVRDAGGIYRRYSDDIIFVVPQEHIGSCEQVAQKAIAALHLSLNNEKTEKVLFIPKGSLLVAEDWEKRVKANLQYLGAIFDGGRILLRHAGIARFQRRRNQAVRRWSRWAKAHEKPIPKAVLLQKFTRKGKDNYLTYADRAQDKFPSRGIARQTAENRVSRQLKSALDRVGNSASKV